MQWEGYGMTRIKDGEAFDMLYDAEREAYKEREKKRRELRYQELLGYKPETVSETELKRRLRDK
jgi:hypothetical protein